MPKYGMLGPRIMSYIYVMFCVTKTRMTVSIPTIPDLNLVNTSGTSGTSGTN